MTSNNRPTKRRWHSEHIRMETDYTVASFTSAIDVFSVDFRAPLAEFLRQLHQLAIMTTRERKECVELFTNAQNAYNSEIYNRHLLSLRGDFIRAA